MGVTNDAETVCNIPLLDLRSPTSRFTLCVACKKAAHRHLVTEKIQPGAYERAWPKLVAALHLKRPDGSSHSSDFDELVPHKIKSWIGRRVKHFQDEGILEKGWEAGGKKRGFLLRYPDWTRAWLLSEWEGDDFTKRGALRLLELYGEPEGWNYDPSSIATLPTILYAPSDDIYPHESASMLGDVEYSASELEDMLRDGVGELTRFNTIIINFQDRMHQSRQQHETPCLEDDIEALCRQRFELLQQLTNVEMRLDDVQRAEAGLKIGWPCTGKIWRLFWGGNGLAVG